MRSTIVGARGNLGPLPRFLERLRAEATARDLEVQAFDAALVFGEDHLLSALAHADRAFRQGTNRASQHLVEVLRYASGERQIATALEKMGVKEGQAEIVLLALGEGDVEALVKALGLQRDDGLIEGVRENLRAFGVTEAEAATVPEGEVFDLVLERVALVDTLR